MANGYRARTGRLDTAYRKTLLDYYEEEIMGEAYFDALAEHFDGEGERDKLRLLARVERRAAEVVQPLLHKHGPDDARETNRCSNHLGEADVAAHPGLLRLARADGLYGRRDIRATSTISRRSSASRRKRTCRP